MAALAELLAPTLFFHTAERNLPTNITYSSSFPASPLYFYHDPYAQYISFVIMYAGDGGNGAHKIQVEFVRVHYDDDGRPSRYYLSGQDGRWVEASELLHGGQRRADIYVARGTHSMYEGTGTWLRRFGLANDVTQRAVMWSPKWNLVELADPLVLCARLGPEHLIFALPSENLPESPKGKLWNFLFRVALPVSAWIFRCVRHIKAHKTPENTRKNEGLFALQDLQARAQGHR